MQKTVDKISFDKPLVWDTPEFIEQFRYLIDNPPLHSAVITIDPVAAKRLLVVANSRNRPLAKKSRQNVQAEILNGDFEITGDTIKFSTKGRLIDGQHRLEACVTSGKAITTHVVFGLSETIFDILDRQRTRTAGDILAICGVKHYVTVAGAVRWVLNLSSGGGSRGHDSRLTPRRIQKLATGSMKGITKWTNLAAEINTAFRFPPTMLAGLLYLIAEHDSALAESFAQDMLHGNRNYTRNKNFDELVKRVQTIRGQNRGALNRMVLAAMLVQTFNHWNANVTATPRALTWSKGTIFPRLAFDKEAFVSSGYAARWSDTTLKASKERLLAALKAMAGSTAIVSMAAPELARKANVPERQLTYVTRMLLEDRSIYIHKKSLPGKPTTYRIAEAA